MSGRRIGKVAVAFVLAATAYGGVDLRIARSAFPASGEARRDAALEQRAMRRREALRKMDEMVRERERCRERFTAPRQVTECEAQFARRYREYNDRYLENTYD